MIKEYIYSILIMVFLILGLLISTITTINTVNISNDIKTLEKNITRQNVEYQFIVTDDSITIFDGLDSLGTIKLEGQLDSIITADNL